MAASDTNQSRGGEAGTQESSSHPAEDALAGRIREGLKVFRGFYLDELTQGALTAAGCSPYVAALPADFDARVRYLGNMLAQMCMAVPRKNERLKLELRTIACALSYLLNSTSFQTGEYHDFDKTEISRKLRRRAS